MHIFNNGEIKIVVVSNVTIEPFFLRKLRVI